MANAIHIKWSQYFVEAAIVFDEMHSSNIIPSSNIIWKKRFYLPKTNAKDFLEKILDQIRELNSTRDLKDFKIHLWAQTESAKDFSSLKQKIAYLCSPGFEEVLKHELYPKNDFLNKIQNKTKAFEVNFIALGVPLEKNDYSEQIEFLKQNKIESVIFQFSKAPKPLDLKAKQIALKNVLSENKIQVFDNLTMLLEDLELKIALDEFKTYVEKDLSNLNITFEELKIKTQRLNNYIDKNTAIFDLEEFYTKNNSSIQKLQLAFCQLLEVSFFSIPSISQEKFSFESGPMMWGKSFSPSILDFLYIQNKLSPIEALDEYIQDKTKSRIQESLMTLMKHYVDFKERSFEKCLDLELNYLAQRLWLEIGFNIESTELNLCGPLATSIYNTFKTYLPKQILKQQKVNLKEEFVIEMIIRNQQGVNK